MSKNKNEKTQQTAKTGKLDESEAGKTQAPESAALNKLAGTDLSMHSDERDKMDAPERDRELAKQRMPP